MTGVSKMVGLAALLQLLLLQRSSAEIVYFPPVSSATVVFSNALRFCAALPNGALAEPRTELLRRSIEKTISGSDVGADRFGADSLVWIGAQLLDPLDGDDDDDQKITFRWLSSNAAVPRDGPLSNWG